MSDYILAKAFAHANDQEQAGMINTMARELFVHCGGNRVPYGFDSQICYISNYINKDGEDFLRRLLEFIELRKKDIRE